jgi:hypothetical protein
MIRELLTPVWPPARRGPHVLGIQGQPDVRSICKGRPTSAAEQGRSRSSRRPDKAALVRVGVRTRPLLVTRRRSDKVLLFGICSIQTDSCPPDTVWSLYAQMRALAG